MTIQHHLSDELLMAYASGALDEASSILVATHLALCPRCRGHHALAERVGGHMLDSLPEAPVSAELLNSVLGRIRHPEPVTAPAPVSGAADNGDNAIPEPLRSYVGGGLKDLRWVMLAPRVHQVQIATADNRSRARLLRFQAGITVPAHGHRGRELTLVLGGSLCDQTSVLQRGDVAEIDERTEHQPYAGPGDDCVCLAVTDAPLRFKSLLARALQPLFGI